MTWLIKKPIQGPQKPEPRWVSVSATRMLTDSTNRDHATRFRLRTTAEAVAASLNDEERRIDALHPEFVRGRRARWEVRRDTEATA